MKLVKKVINNGLCTGCGTCVALCPKNALKLQINNGLYIPKHDNNKCNHCNVCFDICPGYSIDFEGLNFEIFGKNPTNILLGNFLNSYSGFSTDDYIRNSSSSGGLVSQLLIYCLEKKIIDGAIVTTMDKKNPLKTKPFIARTKKDILEASGSKYCPVPLNIVLKKIMETEDEKFAFVGLPCHIHGLLKAKSINKDLEDKIRLIIGLFCAGSKSYLGTEFILKKNGLIPEDVNKISYRGNGWPGKLIIESKNKIISFSTDQYYNSQFSAFTPWRCTLCPDHTCELADISFGDAWLSEFKNDKNGTSIIVSRNNFAQKILEDMCNEKKICLQPLTISKLIQSQGNLDEKKRHIKAKLNITKFLNKKIPHFENYDHTSPKLSVYMYYFLYYIQLSLASNNRYWWAFDKLTNLYQKIQK